MYFRYSALKLAWIGLIAIGGIVFLSPGGADSATGIASATVVAPASVEEALSWPGRAGILNADGDLPLEAFISRVAGDLRIQVVGASDLGLRRSPAAAPRLRCGDEHGWSVGGRTGAGELPACSAAPDVATVTAVTVETIEMTDERPGFIRVTVIYN
jgi:hypothetical protein